MKHPLLVVVMVLMLLTGALSACNLENPECLDMPASWAATMVSAYTEGVGRVQAVYSIPDGGPGIPVTLSWYYPGTCEPDSFRIVINDIPMIEEYSLYDEIIPFPGRFARTVYEDGTSAIYYTWTTEETFLEGVYWWWVIPYSGDYHGERSNPYKILINSYYNENDDICLWENWYLRTTPELVYPRNGETIHTLTPTLIWRDRNPQLMRCNLQWWVDYPIAYSQDTADLDMAEITEELVLTGLGVSHLPWYEELSSGVTFQLPVEQSRSLDINLTECRRTYWTVSFYLTQFVGDAPEDESHVLLPGEIYYFDVDPALCDEISAPMPAHPPASAMVPVAVPEVEANCRSGPTLDYPLLSILPAGVQYEIQARNTAGDAWMVFDPVIDDTCWVAADLVDITGDTSEVEVVIVEQAPPPVTEEPIVVDCSQWNSDQTTCSQNPACEWQPNLYPESPCRNK